ncbi:hypothetical protein Q4489_04190 [Thalassotalea sp. 1_MG-2023]|uniref:hypothetical protein n=1 Tax=Thalassotalea sp. 1_MG-2023 TaxID=3062680 RepID=UPI0026E21AB7|nr:hypothetical protein [Thalassotalea sp. 1_MG-2023]MDO6426196.1 hypothetical protein [Thalassotalea sp. 1_MG-2023]
MSKIRCEVCKGKSTPRCEKCLLLEDKKEKSLSTTMKIVSWFFGVGWAIYGLQIALNTNIIGGSLIVIASLIVIPFTRKIVNKWMMKKDNTLSINDGNAFALAIVSFVIYEVFFSPPPTPEELAANAERAKIIAKEKQEKEKAEIAADRERQCQEKIAPYLQAEIYVKYQLKSPATADFPSFNKKRVEYLGDCTHRVRSYVDSQNSFGAIVRTQYLVELKRGETQHDWELIDLQFQTQ